MKAVFTKVFHWTGSDGVGYCAEPTDKPQEYPKEMIEAAIKAGSAKKPNGIKGK